VRILAMLSNANSYKNSTYGITSIQYPSDWTINKTNAPAKDISILDNDLSDRSVFDIVSFYAPAGSYPPSQHPP
jgi:hypothetical protein